MKLGKFLRALLLAYGLAVGVASADVLMLKNGQAVTGKFQGATQSTVELLVDGQVRQYRIADVTSITFTGSSVSAAPAASAPAETPTYGAGRSTPSSTAATPTPSPRATSTPPAPRAMGITVPAGTVLVVRMIDPVDSSVHEMGQTFRASLDEPLLVDGRMVASRGADVTTKLVEVEQAGRISGRSELALVLLDLTIGGRKYEVTTGEVSEAGASRGSQSAKRIGGLAAVGAVIGAIAGGGKGAAQGAAAGAGAGTAIQVLTRGESVRIPSEARLEFTLANPLAL